MKMSRYYLNTDSCGKKYVKFPGKCLSPSPRSYPSSPEINRSDESKVLYINSNTTCDTVLKKLQNSSTVPIIHVASGKYILANLAAMSATWILSADTILETTFFSKTPVTVSIEGGTIISSEDIFRLNTPGNILHVKNSKIISAGSCLVSNAEGTYNFYNCDMTSSGSSPAVRIFSYLTLDSCNLYQTNSGNCLDIRCDSRLRVINMNTLGIGITNTCKSHIEIESSNTGTLVKNMENEEITISCRNIVSNILADASRGSISINSDRIKFSSITGSGIVNILSKSIESSGTVECTSLDIEARSIIVNSNVVCWLKSCNAKLHAKTLEFNACNLIDTSGTIDLKIHKLISSSKDILFSCSSILGSIKYLEAPLSTLVNAKSIHLKLNTANLNSIGNVTEQCYLKFDMLTSVSGLVVSGKSYVFGNICKSKEEFLKVISGSITCNVKDCTSEGLFNHDPDKAIPSIRMLRGVTDISITGKYTCNNFACILLELFGTEKRLLELSSVSLKSPLASISMVGGYNTEVKILCNNVIANSVPTIDSGTLVYPGSGFLVYSAPQLFDPRIEY